MRRAFQTLGTVLIAVFALLTAAYAATGTLPLGGLTRHEAPLRLETTAARGPIRASGSSALFSVPRMRPGLIQAAEITVKNPGTTGGPVTFTPSQLIDTPGGLPEPLSSVLDLVVQDATNRFQPVTLYSGKLSALGTIALGRFAGGESRLYRFTASWPTGRPNAQDDLLQGAATSVVFDWDAVLDDPVQQSGPEPPASQPDPVTPQPEPQAQTAAPAAPPAGAPTGIAPATAPKAIAPATLRVAFRSKAKGGGIVADVYCRRACTGTVRGTIGAAGSRSTVRLVAHKVQLKAGVRRIYVLRPAGRAAAGAVDAAVRSKKRLVAKLTLSIGSGAAATTLTKSVVRRP